MSINNDASFYKVFDSIRCVHYASEENTEIASCANEKAENIENCSGATVALNDFSVFAKSFGEDGTLTISEDEMKPGFFAKLFKTNKDNIYRCGSALEYANNGGTINRHDIFKMATINDGGLEYAKEDDDIYASALNFAQADISVIEKSYNLIGLGTNNNKLDVDESNQMNTDAYNTPKKLFEELDLDGNIKSISTEEYASYLVAIDSMFELGGGDVVYKESHADGLLTDEEIELASNNEKVLMQAAKEIYSNNYED